MDLLLEEITAFKKDMRIPENLSYKCKNDYYFGMRKAFDDAFNQYSRRMKITYAGDKDYHITPVLECIFNYINSNNNDFNACFSNCIDKAKNILENNKYGLAQKFVNMSFKYVMCFSDSNEISDKLKDCHLPLDKYTIIWIRSFKNKEINNQLNQINNAWANIDEGLYNTIQEFAKQKLSRDLSYTISYAKSSELPTYTLPKERLSAEFIIWHQEKINELHNKLEKSKRDFDRLGIKRI